MTDEECHMSSQFFEDGLVCFTLLEGTAVSSSAPKPGHPPATPKSEQKELLELFSGAFTVLEIQNFREVIGRHIMPHLFELILEKPQFVVIPQNFLRNSNVTRVFADILLTFIVSRLKSLGAEGKDPSQTLTLCKMLFSSVNLFPENEPVLRSHLRSIITNCLRFSAEVKDPIHYFQLLRSLFKAIEGGKFEGLYKELQPLLPELLSSLIKLQHTADPSMRALFVELCLTVPARLSSLLPSLHVLMEPLVVALKAGGDLTTLGLSTFESWIDQLKPDFLYSLLSASGVRAELMLTLWSYIKPTMTSNPSGTVASVSSVEKNAPGPTALRILGKLGSRNRRFLKESAPSENSVELPHGQVQVVLHFQGAKQCSFELDTAIKVVADMLVAPRAEKQVKQQAHRFLKSAMGMLLSGEESSTALSAYIEGRMPASPTEAAECFVLGGEAEIAAANNGSATTRTRAQVENDESMAKILFEALLGAAGDADLKEDSESQAGKLVKDLCRHFGLLYLTRITPEATAGTISFRVFLDALEAACVSERKGLVDVAIQGLHSLLDTLMAVAGGKEKGCRYPVIREIGERAVHCCYKRDWVCKRGGSMMIGALASKCSPGWCISMQHEFLKGLLFVFKDLEPESSLLTSTEATEAVNRVLRTCNSSKIDAMSDAQKQSLQITFSLLLSELPSSNPQVRKNAQSSLDLIATLTGTPLQALLKPFQKTHIAHIFSRNLSQIGVRAQIGFLDALSFCIALDGVIPAEAQLFETLEKALELTTAAEAAIEKADTTGRGSRSVTDLRTTCIELMMNAMSIKSMHEPQHTELRNAIISMFFKSLTYKSKKVLTAAKGGLAKVVNAHQLPKELLQSSLRPILLNLAVHHKLSLGLLQGLSRLLELLSNCFNVTLGEKLLEHLQKWLEPDKITQSKVWKAGEEVRVAAAIVDLFHLLPPAPQKFIEPIVGLVVKLEALYPSAGLHSGEEDEVTTEGSVFRAPLIRFMNRHPTEAIDYFLARLHLEDYSRLLYHMLSSDLGQKLREQLMAQPEKLIKHAFAPQPPPAAVAATTAAAGGTPQQATGVPAPTSMPTPTAAAAQPSPAAGGTPVSALAALTQAAPGSAGQVAQVQAQQQPRPGVPGQYIAPQTGVNPPVMQQVPRAGTPGQAVPQPQQMAAAGQVARPGVPMQPGQIAFNPAMAAAGQRPGVPMQFPQGQFPPGYNPAMAQYTPASGAYPMGQFPSGTQPQQYMAPGGYNPSMYGVPLMGTAPMQSALAPSQRAPLVQLHGVSIVSILAQKRPQWLVENRQVLDCLVKIWNSNERKQRLAHEEQLTVPELRETKLLLTCFLSYCEQVWRYYVIT